jgi:hypothetical protein
MIVHLHQQVLQPFEVSLDTNISIFPPLTQVNIYDQHHTVIVVSRAAIIQEWREPGTNELFRIPLVPVVHNNNTKTILVKRPPSEYLPAQLPPQEAVFNVYELKTQTELLQYLHASAGFPTKPTWLHAVKNRQYTTWPGLTPKAITIHFPESKETLKGHARKTKSGQRSTKRNPRWENNLINKQDANAEVEITRPTTKERNIFIQTYNVEEVEALLKMYTDQTGRFPKKSSRGNQCVMVLVELDSNAILVEGMKDRTSGEVIRAYQHLVDRHETAGIQPTHHVLDNEFSTDFNATITKNHQMTYQLVPPNDHCRNIAEKAIQIFKAHFISIICGADKLFPLHLWCQLLPQAEHTLNMLRPSRMTPTVSAYTYLWGQHDYNANPYAPLGCKVKAYLYPGVRETCAPHTASRYYLGDSKEHYRCHQIYISDTRHMRVCDTVFFKHKYLTMPTITPADALIKAADNLVDTISGVIPKNSINKDLMAIYRKQALDASDAESAQRVLRHLAETQRLHTEQGTLSTEQEIAINEQNTNEQRVPTAQVNMSPDLGIFKFEQPINSNHIETRDSMHHPKLITPFITQDDCDSPPFSNTPQRCKGTLKQDYMLHMMEQPGYKPPFTPQQATGCRCPLQFLCDLAHAVLDNETGDLLEYRHLLKHPKYKDTWLKSFGTEIRRLVTTTETIFFKLKDKIPHDQRKDITYGRVVCTYCSEKKDPY